MGVVRPGPVGVWMAKPLTLLPAVLAGLFWKTMKIEIQKILSGFSPRRVISVWIISRTENGKKKKELQPLLSSVFMVVPVFIFLQSTKWKNNVDCKYIII